MFEKVGILFGCESSEDSGPSDSLHWPEPFTKLLPPAAQDENTNTSTVYKYSYIRKNTNCDSFHLPGPFIPLAEIQIQTFTTKQIQNQHIEQQQIYSNVKAH